MSSPSSGCDQRSTETSSVVASRQLVSRPQVSLGAGLPTPPQPPALARRGSPDPAATADRRSPSLARVSRPRRNRRPKVSRRTRSAGLPTPPQPPTEGLPQHGETFGRASVFSLTVLFYRRQPLIKASLGVNDDVTQQQRMGVATHLTPQKFIPAWYRRFRIAAQMDHREWPFQSGPSGAEKKCRRNLRCVSRFPRWNLRANGDVVT